MQTVLQANTPDVTGESAANMAAGVEWTEEDEIAWQAEYAAWQAACGYQPGERLSRQAFIQEFHLYC